MKKWFYFICILLTSQIYANDSWVKSAGGSYTLLGNKNQNIKMVSEKIKIDLFENYYEMNIEFIFFNYGDTIELLVGFPEYSYGTREITNIRDFQTTINNEIIFTEIGQNLSETIEKQLGYRQINSWYIKNVNFISNDYTISKVSYKANYANHGYYKAVEYLYGTGSTWKDKIDEIHIEIENHTDFWLYDTFFKMDYSINRKNNEILEINIKDVICEIEDTFSISLSKIPAFEYPQFGVSEVRWRLRREIIPHSELFLFSKEQLRILRNSIYAFHGYEFRSLDLQNYFKRQSWYRINTSFSENSFSENERINLENIIREENMRN